MTYFIYVIENLIDGKMYVGKTTRLGKREKEHASAATRCRLLEKAVRKYGWENFDFCIIECCPSVDEMNNRECFWIEALDTLVPGGYNLTKGGEGGGVPSEETRERMSASAKIKIFTSAHRRNIGDAVRGEKNGNYGIPVVGEHRRKLSEAHKKENLSSETRLRMSLGHKGKKLTEEHKYKISLATKGKNNPRYGVKLSEEIKRKIGNSRRRDFCKRGHSMLDSSNIYTKPNGKRRCRECSRLHDRKVYNMRKNRNARKF